MELDAKDKKILFELSSNSRQSYSEIAKKVKLSKEVVAYRIKNLVDNGIITRFFTEFNSGKLDYQVVKAHLKFQSFTHEIEKEVYDFFKDKSFATWVANCSGPWDMICGVEVRNAIDYNQVLTKLLDKFSKNLISKEIVFNIALHIYNKKWLLPEARTGVKTIVGGEKFLVKLDSIDYKILLELAENSKIPIVDIAKKCNLTANAIQYRIKELEKRGIINAYRIDLNLKKLGMEFCKAFVYLYQKTEEKERQLISYCKMHPNITAIIQCIARWDFEIECEVENVHQFNEIMNEIRNKFDFVRNFETVIITKESGIRYKAHPPGEKIQL